MSKKEYKPIVMPSKKCICLCSCCGERFAGDANGNCAEYCKLHKKKSDRDKLHAENREIFGKDWKCNNCE